MYEPRYILAQGETSGVIDQAARIISQNRLLFLDRTKAAVMSYLAGVIKGAIPPYYSYNRPDPSLVTVQEVVAFLYKAVSDKDWLKLQATMDELEALALARTVPQFLVWPSLATPEERDALNAELSDYFELQKSGQSTPGPLSFLGIDFSKVGKYLAYGAGVYVLLLVTPALVRAGRSLKTKS